jgi:hypothetical protein
MADSDFVRDVLILCTRALREGATAEATAQLARWKPDLAVIFHIIASQIIDAKEFVGWSTSANEPGYLMRRFDSLELRVPFHLFDDIPAQAVIDELLRLARVIRSDQSAVICLSGSSAIAGALGDPADIDFCEYLSSDTVRPSALGKAIAAATSLRESSVGCIQVSYWRDGDGRVEMCPPWSEEALKQATDVTARHGKCDFVADIQAEGVIEVTKLILVLGGTDDALRRLSHPAQELPIREAHGWFPRELHDPVELGRYATFLVEQIEDYRRDNPTKAAKRFFSLCRLLNLRAEAAAILELLREGEWVLRGALAGRLVLRRRIRNMAAPLSSRLSARLDETILSLCRKSSSDALAQFARLSSDEVDFEQLLQTAQAADPSHIRGYLDVAVPALTRHIDNVN